MPTSEQIQAAQDANLSALPFSEYLVSRFSEIADGLRRGNDAPALSSLGESAGDLESFMSYLALIGEVVEQEQSLASQVTEYLGNLSKQVESLEEPLASLDLVEVADTLELAIVRNLEEYSQLHESLSAHLGAAN